MPSVAEVLMGVGREESIAIYGDYAVLGTFGESGNGSGAGAAFVFERCGDAWTETQRLAPDDLEPGNRFGRSVAMWGEYLIIGCPHDDDQGTKSGSAYVYHLEDGLWVLDEKILANGGGESSWFGSAVAMWEDYFIVGAHYHYIMGQNGAAYIYELEDEDWTFKKKLQAPDLGIGDKFGYAVDIRDNLAIVGAIENDDLGEQSGAAYIFQLEAQSADEQWELQHKLLPSVGAAGDNFGLSVSISAERALVGSPFYDADSLDQGGVFVFKNQGDSLWIEEDIITSPDGIAAENFGFSLDQDEDKVVVGTVRGNGVGVMTGAVYLFSEIEGAWTFHSKYSSDDGDHADAYGYSVYMKGDNLIVGAKGDDSNAGNAGSAYIYHLGCTPVCTKLLNPTPGAILLEEVNSLQWAPVTTADGFKLGIGSAEGLFDILELQDVGDATSYEINLDSDNDYYVTIQTYNEEGTSTCFSDMFSLDLDVPPVCIASIQPEGTAVDFDTDISWNDVPGATNYVISIGTVSGGTEIVDNLNVGDTTAFDPGSLPVLSEIFVNIIAVNEFGQSENCVEFQFQTGLDVPPVCIESFEPTGIMVDNNSDLSWNAVPGAVGYYLSVGTTDNGVDIVDNMDVGSTTVYDPGALPGLTDIFVTISPYNSQGVSDDCASFQFQTASDQVPTCLMGIQPVGMGVDYTADISWSAVPGATGYVISIGTSAGGADIADSIDVGQTLEFEPGALPPFADIFVTILAYNDIGLAADCSEFQFQTGPNGFAEIDNKVLLQVYPNPSSSGQFTIEIPSAEPIRSVIIRDISGKVVHNQLSNHVVQGDNRSVNVTLPNVPGYYLFTVQIGKAIYQTPLVIVD